MARSFSGDKTQLVPLIKAAIEHKGAAFIDVHQPLRRLQQPRRLDQELRLRARAQRGGEPARRHHRPRRRSRSITRRARCEVVEQHDGSRLALRKLDADYDAARPAGGDDLPAEARRQGRDRHRAALRRSGAGRPARAISTRSTRRSTRSAAKELCPGSAALDKINASLR